ncbi:MAG: hypothetical protein PUD23_08250 [Prevotella sp.]|nr:hypothetical protein [Prevotella sp.]
MVHIKKALLSLYLLLIVVMAAATVVEHCTSTPFVSEHIYGAWWFTLLWALLATGGIAYIVKRHVRKWNILLLHLSLLYIIRRAAHSPHFVQRITFMLYAIALHTQSLPRLSRPRAYHIYMVFCFLSILMTYFGVNYLLSGMHSYA